MQDPGDELLSRSEIARRVGVRRPAVTNWERRHADYPRPVRVGSDEFFAASEVRAWLSLRTIPANALRPDERPGATYADRFEDTPVGIPATSDSAGNALRPGAVAGAVDNLVGPHSDWFRRTGQEADYALLLLGLLHLRGCDPEAWGTVRDLARKGTDPAFHVLPVLETFGPAPRRLGRDSSVPGEVLIGIVEEIDALLPADEIATAFELILEKTAERLGRRGGDLITPLSIRRVLIGLLARDGTPATIYDPSCRSGELLVDAVRELGDPAGPSPAVTGAALRPTDRQVARMNLDVHAITAELRGDTGLPVYCWSGPKYDVVLSNPPFSLKARHDEGFEGGDWRYGPPPRHNADLGWIQHAVSVLTPAGRAAIVMANGAGFRTGREQQIRARLIADGVIECVIALPPALFTFTGIPVSVWVLRSPAGAAAPSVLFIDASELGTMSTRSQRELSDNDVSTILREYRRWGTCTESAGRYEGVPGLSATADADDIRAADHALDPRRYVPRAEDPTARAGTASLAGLLEELERLHERAAAADERVAQLVNGAARWTK